MKKTYMMFISAVLAILIVGGEYVYLTGQQKTVNVVVATQDIMPNESLQGKTAIVKAYSTAGNVLNSPKGYAAVKIKKGSLITDEMVKDQSYNSDLKKVSVKVDLTSAVTGYVKQGSYVDIGFEPKQNNGQPSSLQPGIILKHVQVLTLLDNNGQEIGHSTNAYANSTPASVVLLMSDDDAVKLKNYESQGSIYFIAY
ncbi:RcpC/CpaB family pilus assembly protein [Thermoanaerobacterium sp. RBIITD]|uniref:RcpC/CpaB family pilus assembly protein n=1 Tax=Thermoanaerobacterium sp. RBIITD TaxID=1550240 RepID=UPI000BB845C8|nr:RcpC/CpaB family pilus assembly protein [Thermoanaerobacterium sp. RBIITD]SNX54131.1 Flp pilus assembly protein RcpC/CpaB [Thermoanaerobacterium sp. RBIITD]